MTAFPSGEEMTLRIQKSPDSRFYQLSGRIEAEHISELQKLIEDESNVVLDLTEVKLADRNVIDFLGRSEACGVRLVNCPPYIREWISKQRKKYKPSANSRG
jgi:hypothetical protein